MENGDAPLFSLHKSNLMSGVTLENSALQQENKSTSSVYQAKRKWWDEHDPQSIYRDHAVILNLTETIIYYNWNTKSARFNQIQHVKLPIGTALQKNMVNSLQPWMALNKNCTSFKKINYNFEGGLWTWCRNVMMDTVTGPWKANEVKITIFCKLIYC